MRSLLLVSLLLCFAGAIGDTADSKNWFLNTQGFLVDPLYTAFVIGSIAVIFIIGAAAVLAVVHVASGQQKKSDEEQGGSRQPTVSETDRKTKAEEEERTRKELAEKMRKEEKRKEVLQMYEEWKAGKGITKLAYTKVNPLPDPKYLVAEKGTVVESDVPFTVIGGDGEVIVEGRPRGAAKMEKQTTSTEKSSIKV